MSFLVTGEGRNQKGKAVGRLASFICGTYPLDTCKVQNVAIDDPHHMLPTWRGVGRVHLII